MGDTCSCTSEKAKAKKETSRSEQPKTSDAFEAARIRIVQITDVYTLKNFPHLKTLIGEKKSEMDELGGKTISMLTGDFLAPYLLSSFDKGQGMVNILNKTPIDYVIWGNHEHDLGNICTGCLIWIGDFLKS